MATRKTKITEETVIAAITNNAGKINLAQLERVMGQKIRKSGIGDKSTAAKNVDLILKMINDGIIENVNKTGWGDPVFVIK